LGNLEWVINYEITRLRDCEIARLRDYEITRLRDYEIARLRDCEITRLRDYEIKYPLSIFEIFEHFTNLVIL
jgi:hypothetical protein